MTEQSEKWYHGVRLVADFYNERKSGGRFVTLIVRLGNIVPVAAVTTGVEGYGREEGRRYAELFASAPATAEQRDKLLEALIGLVDEVEKDISSRGYGNSAALEDARQAIEEASR